MGFAGGVAHIRLASTRLQKHTTQELGAPRTQVIAASEFEQDLKLNAAGEITEIQ